MVSNRSSFCAHVDPRFAPRDALRSKEAGEGGFPAGGQGGDGGRAGRAMRGAKHGLTENKSPGWGWPIERTLNSLGEAMTCRSP